MGDESMQTTFLLVEDYSDGLNNVKISEDFYQECVDCLGAVLAIYEIEELFELAALSFVDIEKLMLDKTIDFMLGNHGDDFFNKFRREFNLKAISLLNAFRAYEEQYPQRLAKLEKFVPNIITAQRAVFSKSYDSSFEYRVVYNLRNVAQHFTLPLNGFSIGSSRQFQGGTAKSGIPSRSRHTVDPYFRVKDLIESGKLQAQVRKELDACKDANLNAKVFLRRYVAEFSRCHAQLVASTAEVIDRLKHVLESAYQHVSDIKGEPAQFVTLVEERPDKVRVKRFIKLELISEILACRSRWSGLNHASDCFASSEPTKRKGMNNGDDPLLWLMD